MAPTIIYFIKGGNKGSSGRTKTGRRSKAQSSRLHVGYCLRDWCKVFYEPTDRDVDDDEAAVPAKYLFQTKRGSRQTKRREPAEGEIAFLPHFDPKHIQNTNKKQREEMHKRYLNAAYKFLDADDEQIDALIEEYTDKNARHWQSWFDEAIKWKQARKNRRDRRRARRVEGVQAAGLDPQDVEGLSETSDDSAYETDSDNDNPMPPPPPRRARNGSAFSGGGIGANRGTRRRPAQSPHNSSGESNWSSIGRRRTAPNVRGQPARRLGGTVPFDEDSEDEDSSHMMSGGSGGIGGTPRPGPSPRGGLLRHHNRGPSSPASVNGSQSGNERLGSENFDTRAPENGTPQLMPQDDDVEQPEFDYQAYQGGVDFDTAMQRAIRESEPPGGLPTPQATGNAPMHAANEYPDDSNKHREATRALEIRLPQPPVDDDGDVDVD